MIAPLAYRWAGAYHRTASSWTRRQLWPGQPGFWRMTCTEPSEEDDCRGTNPKPVCFTVAEATQKLKVSAAVVCAAIVAGTLGHIIVGAELLRILAEALG